MKFSKDTQHKDIQHQDSQHNDQYNNKNVTLSGNDSQHERYSA
jgi:hypothetical protein